MLCENCVKNQFSKNKLTLTVFVPRCLHLDFSMHDEMSCERTLWRLFAGAAMLLGDLSVDMFVAVGVDEHGAHVGTPGLLATD